MRKVYAGLGHNVQVTPLFLSQNELDVSAMLAMMQIDVESDDIPLYMHTVLVSLSSLLSFRFVAGLKLCYYRLF